jgi:hypothetical protein
MGDDGITRSVTVEVAKNHRDWSRACRVVCRRAKPHLGFADAGPPADQDREQPN